MEAVRKEGRGGGNAGIELRAVTRRQDCADGIGNVRIDMRTAAAAVDPGLVANPAQISDPL